MEAASASRAQVQAKPTKANLQGIVAEAGVRNLVKRTAINKLRAALVRASGAKAWATPMVIRQRRSDVAEAARAHALAKRAESSLQKVLIKSMVVRKQKNHVAKAQSLQKVLIK